MSPGIRFLFVESWFPIIGFVPDLSADVFVRHHHTSSMTIQYFLLRARPATLSRRVHSFISLLLHGSSIIPGDRWRELKTVIQKKGSRTDAVNYRAISFTSVRRLSVSSEMRSHHTKNSNSSLTQRNMSYLVADLSRKSTQWGKHGIGRSFRREPQKGF